jgi:hypothetical protein
MENTAEVLLLMSDTNSSGGLPGRYQAFFPLTSHAGKAGMIRTQI